jgi:hypothetical protein
MHLTFERVLQAIAQAETLRQAAGRALPLFELTATRAESGEILLTDSCQHIKLQGLHIQPSSQAALQAVFSRLRILNIDISDFSKPTEVEQDTERIADVLRWLLSSPELKDLRIDFVDDGDTVNDDLSNVHRPDNIWIGDQILSMVVETERSNGLRYLDLATNALLGPQEAVQKLIQKHASTLVDIEIYALVTEPMAIPLAVLDLRNNCRNLLRTIAACPQLDFFAFYVDRGESPDLVVDIEAVDREAAMATLQNMILSPTEREYDRF